MAAAIAAALTLVNQTPFVFGSHQNNYNCSTTTTNSAQKLPVKCRFHRMCATPTPLGLGDLTTPRAFEFGGVEPDLSEEPIDNVSIPGVSEEDFPYGYADGAHTWHEGDNGDFKEEFVKVFRESGGPTGFQGVISWLFLPGLFGGMALDIPGDYLYVYTALFIFAFIGIEMAKPDQPFNFEPRIYNMERSKRDKFMEDYNSMSIWDFNEKYKDMF